MPTPKFSTDYDIGFIGFTYIAGFVSAGISWFEHWDRSGPIRVTHTFIVSGENECVEAHLAGGVARAPLTKYFDDPNCRVFFRRPIGWTSPLGGRIVAAAAAQIGNRYNTGLIVAAAVDDSWLGHWLNRALSNWPDRLLSRLLDRRHHWICSQLVAYALAQQPEFRGRGILSSPLDTIDPQQLFEDRTLFEDVASTLQPASANSSQPSTELKPTH